MRRVLFTLMLFVGGCSAGSVSIDDGIVGRKREAAEATAEILNRNEVVHSVVNRPFSRRPAAEAHYVVRAASKNESRGGRWFAVFQSGGEWVVLRKDGRWVRFKQPNFRGDIKLLAPVDIGDAIEILELAMTELDDDEYVNSLISCEENIASRDGFEERELWRKGESEICVEARVYRGLETVGRSVRVVFDNGSFSIVR